MELKFETIKFELQENGLGILTLARPQRMNAISAQFVQDMNDVLDRLMVMLECRVLIMKGNIGIEKDSFCAGLDLKEAAVMTSRKVPEDYKKFKFVNVPELVKRSHYFQSRMGDVAIKMRKISQPIIAIINGPAIGGGFTFSLAADIRIASEKARFGIGATNIGMSGGDLGGSYFLPRLIGMPWAAEIMYTGKIFDGKEADRIGLVHRLVPEDKLMETALEVANELLAKSPLGLRLTKEVLNLTLDCPSQETMIKFDNRSQAICTDSKDIMEALQAFIEKREPKFPLK